MSIASAPAPSHPAPRKRIYAANHPRRPDDQCILQSYRHEVEQRGRRGAFRRTAALYNLSPDTVERIYHCWEAAERAKAEDQAAGIAYEPPDPVYEAERDERNRAEAAVIAARLAEEFAARTPKEYAETDRLLMSSDTDAAAVAAQSTSGHIDEEATASVAETPQEHDAERRTIEPEIEPQPVATTPQLPPQLAPRLGANQPAPIVCERVVRQIVRVPVEARRSGLVAWSVEHEAAAKQIAALAIVIMLVLLSRLG